MIKKNMIAAKFVAAVSGLTGLVLNRSTSQQCQSLGPHRLNFFFIRAFTRDRS
jgi:hypothetical protein